MKMYDFRLDFQGFSSEYNLLKFEIINGFFT